MALRLYDVKLLTITCEILAQKNIKEILAKHKVTGYTTYDASGSGEKGQRGQGLQDEKNIKIEAIMTKYTLERVVEEIARTLFSDFTIIVYVSDVQVVRTEKFS